MSSIQPSLPTGWLVQPPALLPSTNHNKIEPVPIAITLTLAFIVGAILVLFITRKGKDVFLEDRIVHDPETADAASPAQYGDFGSTERSATSIPLIQRLARSVTNPAAQRPEYEQAPKAIATLDVGAHDRQPEISYGDADEAPRAQGHRQYYDPEYDSDEATLHDYKRDSERDFKRDSRVWPLLPSNVSNLEEEGMRQYADSSRPQSYQDGSVRRSPFGVASSVPPGDAY